MSVGEWRGWLPPSILLAVACTQVVLSTRADLSPWKGGGFGMFSTTDATAFRYARIYVTAPGRSEEIAIAPSLEIASDRAALFPSRPMLTMLARRVAAREARLERAVDQVMIEIWRVEFEPVSLRATSRRIRHLTHDTRVSDAAHDR